MAQFVDISYSEALDQIQDNSSTKPSLEITDKDWEEAIINVAQQPMVEMTEFGQLSGTYTYDLPKTPRVHKLVMCVQPMYFYADWTQLVRFMHIWLQVCILNTDLPQTELSMSKFTQRLIEMRRTRRAIAC